MDNRNVTIHAIPIFFVVSNDQVAAIVTKCEAPTITDVTFRILNQGRGLGARKNNSRLNVLVEFGASVAASLVAAAILSSFSQPAMRPLNGNITVGDVTVNIDESNAKQILEQIVTTKTAHVANDSLSRSADKPPKHVKAGKKIKRNHGESSDPTCKGSSKHD
jgi:hypothetical protein